MSQGMGTPKNYEIFKNDVKTTVILSTGGTIEKTYDEEEGSLENRESVIQNKILDRLRYPYRQFVVKAIMAKDSLHMDEQDRHIIFDAIKKFESMDCPIVVLHGTDTMDQTLKVCFERNQETPVSIPIVFTGSMRPLGFVDSDAQQNVIEAIHTANSLLPGFYLSFHGQVFLPPNLKKNKQKKTFEKI